ncbi:Serine/threonine-protein kinase 16 [Phytophthora citrophthora]|uniref:non-specific serine/threonine protein kinase n=1 Tax=Phytophthora citrophthora TaxID=4793 RepID=A0AAD9G9T4_9STRA|nr:Serine/threonine-protein kinase 16 [Phytophthora citrophthora]
MGNVVARVNGKLYEVVGSLGEGGFAHVYEVKRDGRHFALKWTRGVTEGEELERLLLEIQIQRQLQHVNILPLEAAEVRKCPETHGHEHEKEALMLFPLAGRGSLQSLLEQTANRGTAAFTESECLHFFSKLVDAVMVLHELGFAHRDIKPGNILLGDGELMGPLLMDFGSVAPLRVQLRGSMDCRKLWEDAARYSSAPYRAPELWDNGVGSDKLEAVDGRTDVWSLGCVLYAMAFGPFSPFEHPRDGVQHLAIVNGNVSFPHGNMHCGQVFSATFTALIKWILTPDVAERPKLDGVRLCINQLLNPAPRKQPSVRVKRLSSRKHQLSDAKLHQELVVDDSDWADFSAFEPQLMSSEFSFSAGIRSRSSSSLSRLPLGVRSSSPRPMSAKVASPLSSNRDSGLSDLNRRRALSRTGKQLWVSALETQTAE